MRLVVHLAIVAERVRLEGDVRLGSVQLRRVEEAENATHRGLHHSGADAPGRGPMIPVSFRAKAFSPHGREPQSIAFLRAPGIERL